MDGYAPLNLEQLKSAVGVTDLNTMIENLFRTAAGDGQTVRVFSDYGTPEGNVAAGIGSLYLRKDGGAGTSIYRKESTTVATGWVPVTTTVLDYKIKVSSNDTTENYLLAKLAAGIGIALSETGDGGDEDVTISGSQLIFTAGGTFTVPAGVTQVYITGCGAGGGGASIATGGQSQGGGGAGAFCKKQAYLVTPAQEITVTIGAGGLGKAYVGSQQSGDDGGATSFGTLDLNPGDGAKIGVGGVGGAGGAASTELGEAVAHTAYSYHLVIKGGDGGDSGFPASPGLSGAGGSNPHGKGGAGVSGTSAGNDGDGYGCGGSSGTGAQASKGGDGGAGYIRVEW